METDKTNAQEEHQVDPAFSEMEEEDLGKAFEETSQQEKGKGKASDETTGVVEKQLNAVLPTLKFQKKPLSQQGQQDQASSSTTTTQSPLKGVEKGILEVLLEELGEAGIKGKVLILLNPSIISLPLFIMKHEI